MLENRKHKLKNLLVDLQNTYKEYNQLGVSEVEIGCKVLVNYEGGNKVEGRVWGIKKDGTLIINRDGFKTTMNFKPSEVKNLSIGTFGKLEKQIWKITQEISEIENLIGNDLIPNILIDNTDSIIEVVKISKDLHIDSIEFVHAKNLKSYKILLPKNKIIELGYYHLVTTKDGELVSILQSSAFAFKMFYNDDNFESHISNKI